MLGFFDLFQISGIIGKARCHITPQFLHAENYISFSRKLFLIIPVKTVMGLAQLFPVFFPVILIGMVFAGLIYLAFPILIIVGIVTLLSRN